MPGIGRSRRESPIGLRSRGVEARVRVLAKSVGRLAVKTQATTVVSNDAVQALTHSRVWGALRLQGTRCRCTFRGSAAPRAGRRQERSGL